MHATGQALTPAGVSGPQPRRITVLLYSDDVATPAAAVSATEAGGLDVLILDGEAAKMGGLGLCRQLKNEVFDCPPVLVLLGRPQDGWLAAWSQADLAVPYPIDPVALSKAVAELGRRTAPAST